MKKIDKYEIKEKIAEGGNGVVYLVSSNGNKYALKKIKHQNSYTFKRFKNEINILLKENSNSGILPLLDHNIGSSIDDTWYVMPFAQLITNNSNIKKRDFIIKCVLELAETLQDLHSKDITHRDIKPNNIFIYNNKCVFSDFGLVNYPLKEHITPKNKKLGPFATIAPEMRINPNSSNSKLSDIYSLAKTMWILLTGEKFAFEGLYTRNDNKISIDTFYPDSFNSVLHSILENATRTEPTERLTISEFINLLKKHIHAENDFLEQCKIEWKELEMSIFNNLTPNESTWENLSDISKIINLIGKRKQLNHLFFPNGGGLDVQGESIINDEGLLEVKLGSTIYQFLPKSLSFYSVYNDPEFNFFGIDCNKLLQKFPQYSRSHIEDLLEINYEGKVSYISCDSDEYENNYFKPNTRKICRIFDGKLLITSKNSFWNSIPDSYSGIHNKYTFNDFQQFLLDAYKQLKL